jgi:hypothetical protein
MAWADAFAGLVRAAVAVRRGDARTAAALLPEAAGTLDKLTMRLYAAAARRRLGEVLGGDEGRVLVAEADAWMAGQKIQDPARMTAMLAPGFADHVKASG